jgi:uridylate kinase
VGAISQKKEYDYICTKQRNTHMKYKKNSFKIERRSFNGWQTIRYWSLRLAEYAAEIKQIHDKGIEIAIVIGGNILEE